MEPLIPLKLIQTGKIECGHIFKILLSGLWVNGGNIPGQAAQIRISYDWTNGK